MTPCPFNYEKRVCLLDCELMSLHYVDALRKALFGCVDVGLREDERALSIVNVNGFACLLKFLDACRDVFEAGHVLDFECVSCACLLVPSETTTGGQEGFVAFCANQDTLQDVCILLSGDSIAACHLNCLPRAAEEVSGMWGRR